MWFEMIAAYLRLCTDVGILWTCPKPTHQIPNLDDYTMLEMSGEKLELQQTSTRNFNSLALSVKLTSLKPTSDQFC